MARKFTLRTSAPNVTLRIQVWCSVPWVIQKHLTLRWRSSLFSCSSAEYTSSHWILQFLSTSSPIVDISPRVKAPLRQYRRWYDFVCCHFANIAISVEDTSQNLPVLCTTTRTQMINLWWWSREQHLSELPPFSELWQDSAPSW
jgi:hypothetical protein